MVKESPARRVNIQGQRLLIPGSVFHDQTPGVGFYATVQRPCAGSKKGNMWVKLDDDPAKYWFKNADVIDWMVDREAAEVLRPKYGQRKGRSTASGLTSSDRPTPSSAQHLTTPESASPISFAKDTPYPSDFTGATTSTSGGEAITEPGEQAARMPLSTRLAQFGGQAIGLAWQTARTLSLSPWRAAGSKDLDENENIDEAANQYEVDDGYKAGKVVEAMQSAVVHKVHTSSIVTMQETHRTSVTKAQSTYQEEIQEVQDGVEEEEAAEEEEFDALARKSPSVWSWTGWMPSGSKWTGLSFGRRTASPITAVQEEADEEEQEEGDDEAAEEAAEEKEFDALAKKSPSVWSWKGWMSSGKKWTGFSLGRRAADPIEAVEEEAEEGNEAAEDEVVPAEEAAEDEGELDASDRKTPSKWSWMGWMSSGKKWTGLSMGSRAAAPIASVEEEGEEERKEGEAPAQEVEREATPPSQRYRRHRKSETPAATHFASPISVSSGEAGGLWLTSRRTSVLHYHRLLNTPKLKYLSDPSEEELQMPVVPMVRSAPMDGHGWHHFVTEASWVIIFNIAAGGFVVFVWALLAYYGFLDHLLNRVEA
ncbi:unnamed protein product [Ostreobium quekettii]|uniref:Uncharacterized protein n=1 Tax=Ostreobium quekettii TaxID=121088 RepID=A0A8S1J920_9CHLO|nr:unnamed protein product [Ostreobium quekettii]|eukprot:evm.model.scf_256EXC.5 EVM.evm.TU.scf_256EXC.5   scf_256EXC:28239-30634(+)